MNMLLSKDIQTNHKLPSIIRDNSIFRQRESFEKVFDHIGLPTITKPIGEIKPSLAQNIKSSVHGMKINLSRTYWVSNIAWGSLGVPLLFADFMLDRIYLHRFRKEHKEEDLKVVFSASGKEGAWDIATMSMRGISSCQSWNATRSYQLVGSITDPCCGIIYLTNGKKTKYGQEMMYRAVVRYIVHDKLGPCLFMEGTYPRSKRSNSIRAVNLLFASLLNKQTNLPVLYDYSLIRDDILDYAYIPYSKVSQDVSHSSSYIDSGLQYRLTSNKDLNKHSSLKVIQDKYLAT
jgi:hypothetical protein